MLWIQPTPISTHALAVSTAVTRDLVFRRMTWRLFREKILSADMLVFVTPLYYYGMSAQLKTMIDRFCAFTTVLSNAST